MHKKIHSLALAGLITINALNTPIIVLADVVSENNKDITVNSTEEDEEKTDANVDNESTTNTESEKEAENNEIEEDKNLDANNTTTNQVEVDKPIVNTSIHTTSYNEDDFNSNYSDFDKKEWSVLHPEYPEVIKNDWELKWDAPTRTITLKKYKGKQRKVRIPSRYNGCKVIIDNFDEKTFPNVTHLVLARSGQYAVEINKVGEDGFSSDIIELMDIGALDLNRITSKLINNCPNLKKISFKEWDVTNARNLSNIVYMCDNIEVVSFEGWRNINNSTNITQMIGNTNNLKKVILRKSDPDTVAKVTSCINGGEYVLDVSELVTRWVTTLTGVFDDNCKDNVTEIIGLETWPVSHITDMSGLFKGFTKITKLDGLNNWITDNVTNFSNMFKGCSKLESLNFLGWNGVWNTSNVSLMNSMFEGCSSLKNIDGIKDCNVNSVTDMSKMFLNCSALSSLDLSKWNAVNVTSLNDTFTNCSQLQNLDLSSFNVTRVNNFNGVFNGCSSLEELTLNGWSMDSFPNVVYDMFTGTRRLSKINIRNSNIDTIAKITQYANQSDSYAIDVTDAKLGTNNNINSIFHSNCRMRINDIIGLGSWDVRHVTDMSGLFKDFRNITKLDGLERWRTNNLTDTSEMFMNCFKLQSVNLSNCITSLTNARSMFNRCEKLTSINMGRFSFNQSSDVDMSNMFRDCNLLVTLDTNNWVMPNHNTNASEIFKGCVRLENIIGVEKWSTTLFTDMTGMFYNCSNLTNLNISSWNVTNVSSLKDVFYGCSNLTNLDLSRWNTTNVTSLNNTFTNCSALQNLNLSSWDVDSVTNFNGIFNECSSLQEVKLNRWHMDNANDPIYDMFGNTGNLRRIIIQNSDIDTISKITKQATGSNSYTIDVARADLKRRNSINSIFHNNCRSRITDIIGLESWQVDNVTNMSGLFRDFTNITKLEGLNSWRVNNVNNTSEMFMGCRNLKNLDLSNWTTGSLTNTMSMFKGCINLASLNTGRIKFDQSNNLSTYINMSDMFRDCNSLTTLNVSNWTMPRYKTNARDMFKGCVRLANITGVENWSTPLFTNTSGMFYSCNALTSLNLSIWNVDNVADMNNMFYSCGSLRELLLNNWNTNNVTDMNNMFNGCTSLETISLNNWKMDSVTNKSRIFDGTRSLRRINIQDSNFHTIKEITGYATSSSDYAIDVTNADLTGVTVLKDIFNNNCRNRITEIEGLDTWEVDNITDMNNLFKNFTKITNLDLSGWNTEKVTSVKCMFEGCSKLRSLNVSSWDTSKVADFSYAFKNCDLLEYIDLKNWRADSAQWYNYMFDSCDNLELINMSNFSFNSGQKNGVFRIEPQKHLLVVANDNTIKNYDYNSDNRLDYKMNIRVELRNGETVDGFDSTNFTERNSNVITPEEFEFVMKANYDNGSTLASTKSGHTFLGWVTNSRIDSFKDILNTAYAPVWRNSSNEYVLKDWTFDGTDRITLKRYVGNDSKVLIPTCVNGHNVYITEFNKDIFNNNGYITSITTENTSGKLIPISNTLESAFYGMSALEKVDLNKLDTTNVTSLERAFSHCRKLTQVKINNWNTSKVTNTNRMFNECESLTSLDLSTLKTNEVSDAQYMFYNCNKLNSLTGLNSWKTDNFNKIEGMFQRCSSLETLDLSNWDVDGVTSFAKIFKECNNLIEIEGLNTWKTNSLTNISNMFDNCPSLKTVDLSNWDVDSVTNAVNVFWNCNNLTNIEGLNTWNTNSLTNMEGMFDKCSSLTDLSGIENWDVSKVTNMKFLFRSCGKLRSLNLSKWRTTGVLTNLQEMFSSCSSIETLDLSKFNVDNVDEFSWMFQNCTNLTEIKGTKEWTLSKAIRLNGMFGGCENLNFINLRSSKIPGNSQMTDMFELNGSLLKDKRVLLVETNDQRLKDYQFESDNRVGSQLKFNAGDGGSFADNNVKYSDPVFTIEPDANGDLMPYVKKLVLKAINNMEEPKKDFYIFTNWKLDRNSNLSSNNIEKIFQILNDEYVPNWMDSMINVSVPTNNVPIQVIGSKNNNDSDMFSSGILKVENHSKERAIKVSVEAFKDVTNQSSNPMIGRLNIVDPKRYDWETLSGDDAMQNMALGMYSTKGITGKYNYTKDNPLWLIPDQTSNIPLGMIPPAEENEVSKECNLNFVAKHAKSKNLLGTMSEGEYRLILRIE